MHACPSCVHYLEGWRRPGSLLARAGKSSRREGWPRAAPEAAKRGAQLHLVGSETTPKRQQVPLATRQGQGALRAGACGLASLSPLGNRRRGQQPHPGFGLLQYLGMPGQRQPMDAHAAAHTCLCTHTACAVSSGTAGSEPAVPPQPGLGMLRLLCAHKRMLNKGSCPPVRMEAIWRSWTPQLLPARKVWEEF